MSRSAWGVAAAVVIAGVLLLAGVQKLARPGEWRTQSAGLGVWPAVANLVPYLEIGLGSLLLAQWRRHVVAWAAVGLFAVFTGLLALRLARGQRPPCACFGSLSSRPIGAGHVARNLAFITIAVLAATL